MTNFVGWKYQALAALGELRDKMHPDDIAAVQRFLSLADSSVNIPRVHDPIAAPTPKTLWKGCERCGIGANGEILGYVCNRLDCPTKVTY